MNKELKEIGKQLKEILDKYPHRQKEILFYIFGEDTIRKIVNKPTYEELEKEVERLKEREKLVTKHYVNMTKHASNLEDKIIQLETNRDEAIEYLKYALDEEKETPSKYNDWRLDLLEILGRGEGGSNE